MSMRAVTMLPCLIGSWKEVGGGLQMSLSGSFGLNKAALEMPELMQKSLGRPARIVNMVQLGNRLEHARRSARESALCLQLESGGRLPQSQRSRARTQAARPVHGCARTILHRHDGLCRHRAAGNHFLRAQRPAGAPTGTTIFKSRTRPWNRSANAAQMSNCFAHSPSAWDSRTIAFARRSIP